MYYGSWVTPKPPRLLCASEYRDRDRTLPRSRVWSYPAGDCKVEECVPMNLYLGLLMWLIITTARV